MYAVVYKRLTQKRNLLRRYMKLMLLKDFSILIDKHELYTTNDEIKGNQLVRLLRKTT